MKFQLSPEDEAFRQELRQFLRDEVPPERTGVMSSINDGELPRCEDAHDPLGGEEVVGARKKTLN